MKRNLIVLAIIFTLAALVAAQAQTVNNPAVTSVFGKVTAIDKTAKQINIVTASGENVIVAFDERTVYKRVPPGEKTLDKAVDSSLDEISVGDQTFARGQALSNRGSILARQLILMTQREISQRQERKREEWQQRSIAGIVSGVDLAKKEITAQVRAANGTQTSITISTDNALLRRYQPNSVKFSDAQASSLDAVKTGDQIRALGERSGDGSRFAAEEIVSGAFRSISGKIASVDVEKNEFKIVDSQSRQTITVLVSKDSNLRRLTSEAAKELIQKNTDGDKTAALKTNNASGDSSSRGSKQSVDLVNVLETFPRLSVSEIKAGETVVISSVAETGAQQVTAAIIVSGIELLGNISEKSTGSNLRRMLNLDVALF
jgi:hypothetical protein